MEAHGDTRFCDRRFDAVHLLINRAANPQGLCRKKSANNRLMPWWRKIPFAPTKFHAIPNSTVKGQSPQGTADNDPKRRSSYRLPNHDNEFRRAVQTPPQVACAAGPTQKWGQSGEMSKWQRARLAVFLWAGQPDPENLGKRGTSVKDKRRTGQ